MVADLDLVNVFVGRTDPSILTKFGPAILRQSILEMPPRPVTPVDNISERTQPDILLDR